MLELDQRSSIHFAQTVLQVRDHRVGHEQRAGDFEQRGPLDGLHVSPEMAVAVAQVAVPASARPRLNVHRHGLPFRPFVVRTEFFEQRGKGGFQRRADVNFLRDIQSQIFNVMVL